MNHRNGLFLVLMLFLVAEVRAAIPSNKSSEAALEVLAMPEANRLQVAMAQKVELYPELIRIIKDKKMTMSHRWNALSLAAAVNAVSTLPVLNEEINSSDWFMRNAALVVAEKYFPDQADVFAKKLLTDKALVVRSAAVEVLAKKLSPETRDLLWAEFSEPRNKKQNQSLWIRGKIAVILAKNPMTREEELFRRSLNDDELKIKVASIKALEKIHGQVVGLASDSISKKAELWQKYAAKVDKTRKN